MLKHYYKELKQLTAIQFVAATLLVFALAGLLFTAGASDLELLTLSQTVKRVVLCLGISAVCGFALRICDVQKQLIAKRIEKRRSSRAKISQYFTDVA